MRFPLFVFPHRHPKASFEIRREGFFLWVVMWRIVKPTKGDGMVIKCEICFKEIELPEKIQDGQNVLCPFCGQKSVYHRPTRIELPSDVRRSETVQTSNDDVPELPVNENKPKLKIIRPVASISRGDDSRNEFVSQVEARANADRRRKLKAKMKAFLNNFVAILLLVGLSVGGYKLYKMWNDGGVDGVASEISDMVNKVKFSDKVEEASTNKSEDGDVAERKRIEEQKRREAEEAAEAIKKETERKISEAYFAVRNGFTGAKLAYWSELPKNERPGHVENTFGLVVPRAKGRCEYYRIESKVDGAEVYRLYENASAKKLANDEYECMMKEHGGFFLSKGKAYFVTASGNKKSWMAPDRKGMMFDPAKEFFGDALNVINERSIIAKDRKFEIFMSIDEKSEPRKIAEVKFGEAASYDDFARVAKDIAWSIKKQGMPSMLKVKTYKPNVVFANVNRIVKGADGVTRIPQQSPSNRGEYGKWLRLRDEALRQESKRQQVASEAKRARDEWNAKMKTPPSDNEIRRVLLASKVIIKRK